MIVDQPQSEYRIVLLIQPGMAESALHVRGMLLLLRVFLLACASSDSQTQLVKLLNSCYEIV